MRCTAAQPTTGSPAGAAPTLYGLDGADTLLGQAGGDRLSGGAGSDRLEGGLGHDVLDGGGAVFADVLLGGAGNDELTGGPGADTYDGGAGDDTVNAREVGYRGGSDGSVDIIRCGSGTDTVRAGSEDRVASDCEQLFRG